MNTALSLSQWMPLYQQRIEQQLAARLVSTAAPSSARLLDAMRYATLGGGKRLRALLVYATGQSLGVADEQLDAAACAVELIHAYSLVHDDMPAMDDDDLRRGRPTCHKAYDEATALLVGDALQTLAFEILTDNPLQATQQVQLVQTLAKAAGAFGMAGGQAIDLESVGASLSLEQLQAMHQLKTGALIQASVLMGAICQPQVDPQTLAHLDQFADHIGLAFQVQDDVLDVIADTETLGKTQGADIARNKPTYPALLGLEQAQLKAQQLITTAMEQLAALPHPTKQLAELAQFVINRAN